MFALAPSPLPPGHTIIHKYSVQCAPYNETGLLIFPMLATSLGARFGGCELFAVCSHRYRYIRRQCDGNGNDNGNGNSSDDTYRHIAVAVITVSLLPCAHFVCSPTTPALLLLLLLLRFCRRSAYFIRLLVGSPAASYVDVLSLRASATASVAVAATGSGSGCTRAAAVGSAERDTRTYVQAGWQATAIQANFSKLVEFHCTLRRVSLA